MRVARLWRYPVKSMVGEPLQTAELRDGVDGDRRWGVRDSTSGVVLTARTAPRLLHARAATEGRSVRISLPDGRELTSDDEQVDLALSAYVGTPVHLAHAGREETATFEAPAGFTDDAPTTARWRSRPGTFDDGHQVHILTTASLRGGAGLHPGGEWDARRFRPNLLVDCDGDGFPEDEWTGLCIGDVELEVYRRTTRCAMTARSQPALGDDLEVPRALARNRRAELGVYARVRVAGTVTVGTEVRVS